MTLRFEDLQLLPPLLRAVHDEGYETPTPIQVQAIPHVLAGRDLLGLAQTGTGKTAAFALPILQRLVEKGHKPTGDRPIRVLVLTPTRELATQIGDSFAAYGRHLGYRHTVIFGGVGQSAQERALRSGIDILVATPGRLLDLASQRLVHLKQLEIFVLDEADRMLDMGFIHDVRKIIALLPSGSSGQRQTLFFSATMPPEAQKLADVLLRDPATVAVVPPATTVDTVEQRVYFVEKNDKRALLADVLRDAKLTRALVFTRTKHAANRVAEHLAKGGVRAEAIHGNKSQNARERSLANFKKGASRVLVATDIAARGIDIDDISHVINFDLPNVPETYVHRIGRTARAGASGVALSFCDGEEREFLADIERLTRRSIQVVEDHPYRSSAAAPVPRDLLPRREQREQQRHAPSRSRQPQRQQQHQQRPQQAERASSSDASAPRPATLGEHVDGQGGRATRSSGRRFRPGRGRR